MHGDGGAAAGQLVHLAGIAKLLFGAGGGRVLYEFAEARAGVGEAPGGQFDPERVQRLTNNLCLPI